jgi:hypothetical protein
LIVIAKFSFFLIQRDVCVLGSEYVFITEFNFFSRSTHKSISGHRLAKLAHKLLSKYYNLKNQKAWGSMELADHIGADGLTSHSNLEETVHVGGTGHNENCIDDVIPDNRVGEDKLSCPVNLEEMVCARTEGDNNCFDGKAKKRIWSECNGHSTDGVVDGSACSSNLEGTVTVGGAGGDETCINIKSRKRRKGRKLRDTLENNVGAEKLECPLNLGPTVSEVGAEAKENSVDNGVPNNQIGETGASGLACNSVAPDKKCVNGKSRKQKQKRKESNAIVVLDNHEGAKDFAMEPTCCEVGTEADKNSVDNGVPNNHIGETGASGLAFHSVLDNHEGAMDLAMGPTVCKVGTEADKNSGDNGVPNNHIGETGASGLACHSVTPDKKCVDGKSRKRKRKQRQNNAIAVLDNHEGAKDLAFPSDLRLTVCEAGVGADKNRVDNGTPNKLVVETGVNGLACANEVRDYGKSSKRKRKRKQSNVILVADNHVDAKGLTTPSNWMPTVCDVWSGAVKCVDHGVPEKQVGETSETGFAGANGVPDKNCVDDKLRRQEGTKVPVPWMKNIAKEGLACTSNWGPTVCEERIIADENCVESGLPDNHLVVESQI